MDTAKMVKWIIFSFVSIILIFFAFIGGYYMGTQVGNQGYIKGWSAAKKQIEKAGIFPEDNQPALSINGRITSVIGNTITIEAGQLAINPLSPQTPTQRTIILYDNSIIIHQRQKTAQEYEQEQVAYFNDLKENKDQSQLVAPNPYQEEAITANDLKINDYIAITAGKNIRYEKTIQAEKIVKMDI